MPERKNDYCIYIYTLIHWLRVQEVSITFERKLHENTVCSSRKIKATGLLSLKTVGLLESNIFLRHALLEKMTCGDQQRNYGTWINWKQQNVLPAHGVGEAIFSG